MNHEFHLFVAHVMVCIIPDYDGAWMMRRVCTPFGSMEVLAIQCSNLSVVEMEGRQYPPKISLN